MSKCLCAYNKLRAVLINQEEQNRGKPNWEHLTDELHVLLTVEDTENRATLKLARAVEEVKKLLVPVVRKFQLYTLPLLHTIIASCTKNARREISLGEFLIFFFFSSFSSLVSNQNQKTRRKPKKKRAKFFNKIIALRKNILY